MLLLQTWADHRSHRARTWWRRRTWRRLTCTRHLSSKMPHKWLSSSKVLITNPASHKLRHPINNSNSSWTSLWWIKCCSSTGWTLRTCSSWCRTRPPYSKWCTKCSNNQVTMLKIRRIMRPCRSRLAWRVRLLACKQQMRARLPKEKQLQRRE